MLDGLPFCFERLRLLLLLNGLLPRLDQLRELRNDNAHQALLHYPFAGVQTCLRLISSAQLGVRRWVVSASLEVANSSDS